MENLWFKKNTWATKGAKQMRKCPDRIKKGEMRSKNIERINRHSENMGKKQIKKIKLVIHFVKALSGSFQGKNDNLWGDSQHYLEENRFLYKAQRADRKRSTLFPTNEAGLGNLGRIPQNLFLMELVSMDLPCVPSPPVWFGFGRTICSLWGIYIEARFQGPHTPLDLWSVMFGGWDMSIFAQRDSARDGILTKSGICYILIPLLRLLY